MGFVLKKTEVSLLNVEKIRFKVNANQDESVSELQIPSSVVISFVLA